MDTVAILVDGGYYLRRAKKLWGETTGEEAATMLHDYCCLHLSHKEGGQTVRDNLYRIFYYDCPPLDRSVFHPLLQRNKSMKKEPLYQFMMSFQDALRSKRKVALRLGRLSENGIGYNLTLDAVKKLLCKKITIDDLSEADFILATKQKGVDMRIGLDIASMAYKKQVTKIILIAGDSDFVPAAKLARREGIDFVLDPMGANINPDLNEHIDGIMTPTFKRREKKECQERKNSM